MFVLGCSQPRGHRHPTLSIPPQGSRREICSTLQQERASPAGSGAAEGRAKETQPVIPQGSDLVHTGKAGSDRSSHKPGVGGNKARRGQSCISDSHYKNSVYWFNKFTSLFLWMTSVCTTMEGTLGEAVFRYLFTILWKDIQSVNFQTKFEHYNEK